MLVWRKGNIEKNCLCVTVLCTVIMVHKGTSSSYSQSTVSGFDLTWFSSLSSKCLCVFGLHGVKKSLLTSFSVSFSELSLVGLALDLIN